MRDLTKAVYVPKEKTSKLKIFTSLLFQGKKSWNFKYKFKYSFSIALCKKATFFDAKKKPYSETLKDVNLK